MTWILIITLLFISVEDIRTHMISDGFTVTGTFIAIIWHFCNGNILFPLVGCLAGVLIVWLLHTCKLQRVGGGDAKLMGMIGAFMGWQVAVSTFLLSSVFSILSRNLRKLLILKGMRGYAYSPFITMAFMVVIVWNGI